GLNTIKNDVEKEKSLLEQANSALAKAQETYEKEKKEESTRDKLKIDLQKYREFLPIVEESVQMKKQIMDDEQKLKNEASHLEQDKKERKKNQLTILTLIKKKKKKEKKKYIKFLNNIEKNIKKKKKIKDNEQKIKKEASHLEHDKKERKNNQLAILSLKKEMKQQETGAKQEYELQYELEKVKK